MGRSAHADRIRAPSKLILLLFICLTAFVPVLPLPDKAPGCDVVKDQWQDLCARGECIPREDGGCRKKSASGVSSTFAGCNQGTESMSFAPAPSEPSRMVGPKTCLCAPARAVCHASEPTRLDLDRLMLIFSG